MEDDGTSFVRAFEVVACLMEDWGNLDVGLELCLAELDGDFLAVEDEGALGNVVDWDREVAERSEVADESRFGEDEDERLDDVDS